MNNSSLPTRKVGIGGAVSGVCAALVWALNTYYLSEPIPAEIGMGLATAITFGVQYVVSDAQG